MLRFAEGALNIQSLEEILPIFIEQLHQEVDREVDTVHNLLICHPHVANNHYCGLYFISFGHQVPILGQQGRELASLIQGYTQDLWNLLDKRLLSQKGIIVLGQFLDQFLILVAFLQRLVVHVGDVHSFALALSQCPPEHIFF